MKTLSNYLKNHRLLSAAGAVLGTCLLLSASVLAQNPDDNIYGDNSDSHSARNHNPNNNPNNPDNQNYPGDNNNAANHPADVPGIAAGGNWHESDTEDKMTAAKRVKFELISDNSLRANRDAQSRVEIYCENGKYKSAEFVPGVRLAPPNRPGFWGQPQMEVMVRVDGTHDNHGWNWNGHFLSMDKGTTREMLGAQVFKIEFLGPRGPEIAEFTPAGVDLSRVANSCGLTPKKP